MISENAPSSSSRSSNGPWQPPSLEEIQVLFPQYEIVALLGRGGMGAVYKGWQRSLDRFVAIKILPSGLTDDPQYSERFKQEAKSMAKLSHPGIVAVFDAGELANGMLYFVMEFIEGTDVQKMIAEQGSLQPAHAMAITAHVCDALQYAHDRSIIHRDIKPANIMVGYDGVVKVADFGLAKQQQEGAYGLTQSGMVMGTLHYMAPESLILGVSVDHRADIYAVGVMLYQMLTGRLPQGLFEMPSQKVPGLDPHYDDVIAKSIREDRDIRYQSAAELRADLDSILTQPVVKVDSAATQAPAALPTVARPQRPQGYVQRPVQSVPKKRSSTGLLLVAVLVLAAGGFFVFRDQRLPQAAPAPVLAAEAPKADPATSGPSSEETVKKDAVLATKAPATSPPPTQPAKMPAAAPKVTPAAPKPAAPQTDLEKRIAALETGFQNAAKAEPEQVFQQSMAALNKSYLAALDRSLAAATQKGELDDAVALRDEKQRMEKGSAVPGLLEEAATTVPVRDAVKKLRETYRTTQQQHATAKAKAVAALYDKYDLALAALQADLTKAQKLDDALLVKPLREQIKARKEAALALKPIAAISLTSLGITNSLGMRLVPVPGTEVLMCVHETRRQDFAVFAQETSHGDNAWKDARAKGHATASGHEDGHPVVSVTWEQAVAFCEWLSKREGLAYRLPSDWEWSMAAGLSEPQSAPPDRTPKSFSGSTPDRYPWGSAWPPPSRAGNFLDLACWKDMAVPDFDKPEYDDGFPTTAPVMSFPPNSLGIFDLAGNVTEWCADWYDAGKTEHVSRGSAWYRKVDRGLLGASFREHSKVGFRNNGTGFRLVVKSPAAATPAASSVAAAASKMPNSVVINSLGMKFVPVPGTQVLFCIHETRHNDYAAYAAENQGVDDSWKDQESDGFMPVGNTGNHPVVKVNWDDAQKFCSWLSKKEGKTYRLPTDQEWSHAVGVGQDEQWSQDTTPATVSKNATAFPWGGPWPPPKAVGNFSDESRKAKVAKSDVKYLPGYDDGFPTTAPVMSFQPNRLGLYDLDGNVREWVEDWYDTTKRTRVLRGGSWLFDNVSGLLSSSRAHLPPAIRGPGGGFRIVVAAPAAAPAITSRPPSAEAVPVATTQTLPAGGTDGFTNSLGMKFVPVPGTRVLMCVHETRRQDYAAYADKEAGVSGDWKNKARNGIPVGHEDNHPVVGVSWEEADAFCAWLGRKEGRSYRLPTDREWSVAVGIGEQEEADAPAMVLSDRLRGLYHWGTSWPPPARSGNYADLSCRKIFASVGGVEKFIDGYEDGFPTTAPVMSFAPNGLGLYDLGGNVWEITSTFLDVAGKDRGLRGGSWDNPDSLIRSARRIGYRSGYRSDYAGFRVVAESGAPGSVAVVQPAAPAPVIAMPHVEPPPPTVAGASQSSVSGVPEMVFFETKGQVTVIDKDGQSTVGGVATPQGPAVTSLITSGCIVKTGPASSADLALAGGGSLRLDANSELKLSNVVAGKTASESFELIKGGLFLHIDTFDLVKTGRTELRFKTAAAAIAVKGAKCFAEISPAYDSIGVFQGNVEVAETKQRVKTLLRADTTVAVKSGAISPPKRLSMAQVALAKICDEIELLRTEQMLLPDEGETLEDIYHFVNSDRGMKLQEYARFEQTEASKTELPRQTITLKHHEPPTLDWRTAYFTPHVDLKPADRPVIAIEIAGKSDGLNVLFARVEAWDASKSQFAFQIVPKSVPQEFRLDPGAGGWGTPNRKLYPLFEGTTSSIIKSIRPTFDVRFKQKQSSGVPGRKEYRFELSSLIVVSRKR